MSGVRRWGRSLRAACTRGQSASSLERTVPKEWTAMIRDRVVGLGRRRGWGAAVVSLTGIVVIWWLLIAAVAAQTLPAAVASAPKADAGLAVGQTARIHLPGLSWLPIPVERAAFDEAERGYRESDDDAIEHAFTAYEWIRVS